MNDSLKGILAMVAATLCFGLQDTFTKQLTVSLPAWQIVSIRFFFFSVFALVYAARTIGIRAAFRSSNPGLQVVRGIIIVCEITLFAFTIAYLGLAELHAVFACYPLLVTALSGPFLGEDIGWRRWLAVSIGFVGTLIILKPGTGIFNPYALLALACAVLMSVYTILTRKQAGKDQFETSLLFFGISGFLLSALFAIFIWQPVSPDHWSLLLLLSVSAIFGHYLLIKALLLTPAVILQPFNYFMLIWAIILGYLVFDEVLDWVTLAGIIIVVTSGVFIAKREYTLTRKYHNVGPGQRRII